MSSVALTFGNECEGFQFPADSLGPSNLKLFSVSRASVVKSGLPFLIRAHLRLSALPLPTPSN